MSRHRGGGHLGLGLGNADSLGESFKGFLGRSGRHTGDRNLVILGFVVESNFMLMEKERHRRV